MPEREPPAYPTNWVSKNDLYLSRPDLEAQINALEDGDMLEIASQIGDAVAETHDVAIDEILTAYLGISDTTITDEPPDMETSALSSQTPETPPKTPDYNGWKGNGKSLASAQLTYLTFLWLNAKDSTDKEAYDIVNTSDDLSQAQTALRERFEQQLLRDKPVNPSITDSLLRNFCQHHVNWAEIVRAYHD